MLTVTDTAATVVKRIVSQDPAAGAGGLRIGLAPDSDRQVQLNVVAEPLPGDALVENDGARVYVDNAASTVLDDKTLDAQLGENGAVTFALVQTP